MSSSSQNDRKTGYLFPADSSKFIKINPAHLTAFIALNGFALAVVVLVASLTIYFAVISWKALPQECPDPQVASPPSVALVPVPCESENSISDVVVASEKNQWADDLVKALWQIQQALENDDGSISNVVIDPKENPWIGHLLAILYNMGQTQVTNATVREYTEKQMQYANEANSSAECTAPESGNQDVVAVLNVINSNLKDINKQLGNQRTLLPCDPTGTQAGEGCANNRDVLVVLEQDASASELKDVLEQIQKHLSDNNSPALNVVIDSEKHEALINALKDAGKPQQCVTGTGENPGSDGEKPVCNVTVNLEEPQWVDDLVGVLHGAVEFYAIDPAIRADIKQHLKCDGDKRLTVSGLIRFQGDKHSLRDIAKDNIDNFLTRIDRQTSKWGVFGFASESGDKEVNRELSWRRACEVKRHICESNNPPSCEKTDCNTYPGDKGAQAATGLQCLSAEGDEKTYPLICFLGEQHFINGVADSRSVVIAACTTKD